MGRAPTSLGAPPAGRRPWGRLRSLLGLWLALLGGACGAGAVGPDGPEGVGGSTDDRRQPDGGISLPPNDGDADGGRDFYTFPCLAIREPTGEPTFEAVYLDIICRSGCADPYCHGARGTWADLSFGDMIGAYESLIDMPPGRSVPVGGLPTCRDSDVPRVTPGEPARSLLYLKVSDTAPCGGPMPPADSGWPPLSEPELAQIEAWIAAGAPLHSR